MVTSAVCHRFNKQSYKKYQQGYQKSLFLVYCLAYFELV